MVILTSNLNDNIGTDVLSALASGVVSAVVSRNVTLRRYMSAVTTALPIYSIENITCSAFAVVRLINGHATRVVRCSGPGTVMVHSNRMCSCPGRRVGVNKGAVLGSILALERGSIVITVDSNYPRTNVNATCGFN